MGVRQRKDRPLTGVDGPRAVTVVIVTYNSAGVLQGCLEALPAALVGVETVEVVVADNLSGDGSLELAARLAPGVTIVQVGRNAGYSAGINAGIAAAKPSDAVLVLNPDVRLAPGCVSRLAGALDELGTGITVPRILGPDGRLEHSLRRGPRLSRAMGEALLGGRSGRWPTLGEVVTDPRAYESGRTADWATGAVMMISRRCIDAAAAAPGGPGTPWDESFFLYSEETEFALRAKDVGFVLRYVPDAEAVHLGGESTTSPELWALLSRNKVVLHRRRHGRLIGGVYGVAVALNQAVRAVSGSPTHRAALRALVTRSGGRPPALGDGGNGRPGWICFSAQDWWYHNRAHSDFQLMTRLAKSRRVLFVNSITMRMPLPGRSTRFMRRLARKALSMARVLRQPVPGLPDFFVLSPVILPLYGSRAGRALNAALVRRQVTYHARRLGLVAPVVTVTIPTAWEVVRPMVRRALVFNRSDKHSAFGEADGPLIAGMERELLRRSDRILYVSRSLMADESPDTGDRAVFLDHGVDLVHFRHRPPEDQPADLREIPRPRIGFFGGLDDYVVDFDLLELLAAAIPEASIVLIGDATCSMRRFEQLPNVHWLGFRSYEEIPRYGSGFDVAIMPWLANEWIAHCNPIKLKEYLALGLPVVTTEFPEAHRYRDVMAIATDHGEFIALARAALAGASPADETARRAAVAGASWDRRARELLELGESTGRAPGRA